MIWAQQGDTQAKQVRRFWMVNRLFTDIVLKGGENNECRR